MRQEKDPISREGLDRAGRLLTKSAVVPEQEVSEITESSFLFTRIRARIVREEGRVDRRAIWTSFWEVSKRAIPAMMLLAALSFALSVYMTRNKSQATAFSVDAYLGTNESGIENMVFAERRPLTRDEVLATIISRDEREAGR